MFQFPESTVTGKTNHKTHYDCVFHSLSLEQILKTCMWCGLWFLLIGSAAGAQSTGTITGIVQDMSGAVVPTARLTLRHEQSGIRREAETGEAGEYSFFLLPPGLYQVIVEKPGFRRAVRNGVNLDVNQVLRADFALSVGQLTEEIRVTEQVPLIEPITSTRGQVLDGRTVTQLPLNARTQLFSVHTPRAWRSATHRRLIQLQPRTFGQR